MKLLPINSYILGILLLLVITLPVDSQAAIDQVHVEDHEHESPGTTILPGSPYVWLYSFLAIMLVSASGFIGILLVPFMNRSFYNVSTQYLIALSVGSLIGDAFLHLIPHALVDHAHSHDDTEAHRNVLVKGLVILLGLYAFFLTERITILYQNNSTRKKMKQRWVKKSTLTPIDNGSLKSDHNHLTEALLPYKEDRNNSPVGKREQTKSFSEESTCSINSHNNNNQDDDCLEKETGLSSDHSHLICTADELKHPSDCDVATAKEKCLIDYVDEDKSPATKSLHCQQQQPNAKDIAKTGANSGPSSAKGMRSHVGGVDTAPPSFSIPLRCHHVNMRHCRSPNVRHHHHLHRRIFHLNSQNSKKKIFQKNRGNFAEENITSENRRALSANNIDSRFHNILTTNGRSLMNSPTNHHTHPDSHGHSHEEAQRSGRLQIFLSKFRTGSHSKDRTHDHPSVKDQITITETALLKSHKKILSSQSDSNLMHKNDDDLSSASELFFTPTDSKEIIKFRSPPHDNLDSDHGHSHGKRRKKSKNGHSHHHSHCLPSGYTFVSPLRDKPHGHHHGHSHDLSSVRSIAYTIIAGDGLHNFCDGIAIGAAFSANTKIGLSTFLAVICHELPHELGDFAVLLNAGMPVKTVIFYNCLTGIFCFTGMIIGVLLSNSSGQLTEWLFLATAGIFIYIALVDMVPELATQRLKGNYAYHRPTVLFIVQNFGLFTGVGVMTAIALIESGFG